jgi:hypothetical protein
VTLSPSGRGKGEGEINPNVKEFYTGIEKMGNSPKESMEDKSEIHFLTLAPAGCYHPAVKTADDNPKGP